MHPFEQYLQQHNLMAFDVSLAAKVRYMNVWNAVKGYPITREHAQKIRQAVLNITKVPYTGIFVLTEPEIEDAPTVAIKKLPRHN